jgi:hypothetical protein
MYVAVLAAVDLSTAGRAGRSLASAVASERQSKREKVDAQWARHYRPGGKRLNGRSKAASTDLARLDIADWLAKFAYIVVPEQWRLPDGTTPGSRTERELNEQTRNPSSDSTEFSELQLEHAEPGDGRGNNRHALETEGLEQGELDDVQVVQSNVDQVTTWFDRGESQPGRDGGESDNRPEPQTEESEQGELDDVQVVRSKVDQVTTWSDSDGSLPGRVTTGVGSKDYDQYEGPSAERLERGEPDDGPVRPSAVEQVIVYVTHLVI